METAVSIIAPAGKGKQNQHLAMLEGFAYTSDAKDVIGVCTECQKRAQFGIVIGRSGFGKTYALKHYAKLPHVARIECEDSMGRRDLVKAIESAVGLPHFAGSIWERLAAIRSFFTAHHGYLLIIDEADKLISRYTQSKIETIRAIFDQCPVGVVIAGEPNLKTIIQAHLPRLENRVDKFYELQGLTGKEVENFLTAIDIQPEALAELKRRGCNKSNGCFRLLNRTLKNALLLMESKGENVLTVDTLDEASHLLLL